MAERESRLRRSLDAVAKGYRDHKGAAIGNTALASGIALELSPAPSPAKEITASALVIAGAVTTFAISFADYCELILNSPHRLNAENAIPQSPSGFHEEETTMMSPEEIASAMAEFAREHPNTT